MNYYNDFKIHSPLAQSNENHLQLIEQVLKASVWRSRRVAAFRFDLRFPKGISNQDDHVITKFFESLKAQLAAKDKKNIREGRRVYPHYLHYAWTRERDTSDSDHFHCVILLNKDAYSILGNYDSWEGNMAARIKSAWVSALGMPGARIEGLVHFPMNGTYYLDLNSDDYFSVFADLFYRLSYFAKLETKGHTSSRRNFGCSRV